MPTKKTLEDIQPILIVGLDTYEDQVELTVMSVGSQAGSEPDKGGGSNKIKIYEASGKSVYEAKQNMSLYSDKHLIWAHLEYIIIGDETARNGIAKHMDFFMRNHENRLTDELVIAKGMTAKEFIKNTNTDQPKINEKIRHLFNDAEVDSISRKMNLKDFALRHQSDTMVVMLPVMDTTDKTVEEKPKKEGEATKKDIRLAGYAIFDRDARLIDYASFEYSRGINRITDQIKSAVVVIEADGQGMLSAAIIRSKTRLDVDEDAKTLKVDISVLFNIPEYTGNEDLYDEKYITRIKKRLEENIETEVLDTMTYLQNLDADAVGISDVYYHKYPEKWPQMKSQWQDLFKVIKVDVTVNSTVRNTYNITNPIQKG